jgi:hypothetical protein
MAVTIDQVGHTFDNVAEDIKKMERSSNAVAKTFDDLINKIIIQRPRLESIFGAFKLEKLPLGLGKIAQHIATPLGKLEENFHRSRIKASMVQTKMLDLENRINYAYFTGNTLMVKHLELKKSYLREFQAKLNLTEKDIDLRRQAVKFTGEQFSYELLFLRNLGKSLKLSGDLNRSLVDANSNLGARYQLNQRVLEVGIKTGHAFQGMLDASRSLTEAGFDLRGNFADVLDVVVKMKDGLGVSYENSAQLARIFEINLKSPVQEVADRITAIKQQTSLTADEATRFTTEIGKALQLLGPGAIQGSAGRVATYVTLMAGSMKDVGGDAQEVVKIFSEMTKGTAQGFMLRGLSGVQSPGAVGTEAGAQAAMQNFDRLIRNLVSAAPGTMAYVAQLEAAAQIMGTSAETVVRWRDMMQKANEPLDENQKLLKAWQEQTAAANMAVGRLRESIGMLTQRAFSPLLRYLTPVINALATFVGKIAASPVSLWSAVSLVGVGTGVLIVSLSKLIYTFYQSAVASAALAKAELLRNALKAGAGAGAGAGWTGWLLNYVTQHTTASTKGLTALNTRLLAVVTRLGSIGPFLAIAVAGAIGYGVGTLIRKAWESWNPFKKMEEAVYSGTTKAADKAGVRTAAVDREANKYRWDRVMGNIQQMIYAGKSSEVEPYFRSVLHRIPGADTAQGIQNLLNRLIETQAISRERLALFSPVEEWDKTKAKDAELIAIFQAMLYRLGTSGDLLKKSNEAKQREMEQQKYEKFMEFMHNSIQFKLTPDPGSINRVERYR